MPPAVARLRTCWRGISAGLLTPFDEEGAIEFAKIRFNARELYDRDVRSFLTVANISEYHSLARDERIRIADTIVETLPSDVSVMAGVGGSTKDAIELIEGYADVGVHAMMVMPPHHTYLHESGLIGYYRALADATDRPLVPYVREFDPSVDFFVELANLDGVAGIKYAIPRPAKLGAAVEESDDDVVWINGMAETMALAMWVEGSEGFSAGVSNFRPEIGQALFESLQNEAWGRARRLRNLCLPFDAFRDEPGENNSIAGGLSVPVVKKGLDLAGLEGGSVREPLRPLTAAEEERVENLYEELDQGIDRLLGESTTV